MAIIACPECGKKISSRAVICSHCGMELGEVTEQDRQIHRARRLRDRIYHLSMLSYLAISVFLAGFGWYWATSGGFTRPPTTGPLVLLGIGALAYVVMRALLFRARQERRKMRQLAEMTRELRRNL